MNKEVSKQMAKWGRKGRKNLREKLGEEGFRAHMSRVGKANAGKPRRKRKSVV